MPSDFDTLRRLYDNNQFAELIRNPEGIYWLKMLSISRPEQLRQFCHSVGLECEGIAGKQLFAYLYRHNPDVRLLESFIRDKYQTERVHRLAYEEFLISQLYQMRVFDWGGLYQNSLERTIINNYVKRIQNWDQLSAAIENEIHSSLKGYVQCSWYNHWSSILIEDIFKDHPSVLPATGQVKKVDFFIHDFPFDLKVTYFPVEYMQMLRKAEGLRPELTELKRFCRSERIWFDNSRESGALFQELLAKVAEHPAQTAREFFEEFKATRIRLIQRTVENPAGLKVWLYENQGVRRFDASNRFFLILVNTETLEESWKLKRNKTLLVDAINRHLSAMRPESMNDLQLEFHWQGRIYEAYADVLFVIVGAAQIDATQ